MAERTDELAGKVAIVTGGAAGIGQGIALDFLRAGAAVVIADLKAGDATRQLASADGLADRLHDIVADVTQDADVAALVDRAQDVFGRLDIMVNNAGGSGAVAPLLDIDVDGFDRTFALLVRSVFLGIKHAGAALRRQGDGGVILSTASMAAQLGGCSPSLYAAAKAAVVRLSAMAAVELAPWRIRVNTVSPGAIMGPAFANSGVTDAQLLSLQPWQDVGTPSDVAAAMIFLASDRCRFATGSDLVVDGGLIAQGAPLLERLYGKSG